MVATRDMGADTCLPSRYISTSTLHSRRSRSGCKVSQRLSPTCTATQRRGVRPRAGLEAAGAVEDRSSSAGSRSTRWPSTSTPSSRPNQSGARSSPAIADVDRAARRSRRPATGRPRRSRRLPAERSQLRHGVRRERAQGVDVAVEADRVVDDRADRRRRPRADLGRAVATDPRGGGGPGPGPNQEPAVVEVEPDRGHLELVAVDPHGGHRQARHRDARHGRGGGAGPSGDRSRQRWCHAPKSLSTRDRRVKKPAAPRH
jgi:hypothetical protein